MKIIKATYGIKDVINQVNALISFGRLDITVSNDHFGDPAVGTLKCLIVNFEIDGAEYTCSAVEGEEIHIPESPYDRLGIFYTNNNNPKIFDIINFSLGKIKIASHDKADIITSVFHLIPSNPFPQYASWFKDSSALNIVLQILQLLYIARKRKNYKYVSFLEHDVLYPEGYFDYPDFESGNVMTNMNYIGLCEKGWQISLDHEPLHEMTMTFEDAINHFQLILQDAILMGQTVLENTSFSRKQWQCENPAVHVNHGYHFTTHFTIYSTKYYQSFNKYWGDKDDYRLIFPEKESVSPVNAE